MAIVVLLAAAATAATPLPDPIAQANDGQAQCYSPDVARKVCASMATYKRRADGGIDNASTVLLAKTPLVLMTTVQDATANIGRLCESMTKADIVTARFQVNGAALDDVKSAELRAQVLQAFAEIIDHLVCATYVADGSRFVAHLTFDGVPRPALDQRVMWVSPADGWKVAP